MTAPISRRRKVLFTASYLLLLSAMAAAGIKFVDWQIGKRYVELVAPDMDAKGRTIRMLDLYPYDGFHVQSYAHHKGPMFWEQTSAFNGAEATTGNRGYFIDFELDHPPAKLTNEFRIILFGGSGAQGWGATSQDKMLYKVIEGRLAKAFPSLKIRVINMAMGSSTAYQNFIALNQWGHALHPDLMLGYVGRNDYIVPLHEHGTDWYCYSEDIQAFTMATRGYDCPPGLRWISKVMPNLMRKSSVGLGLKVAFGMEYYRGVARQNYARATHATASALETIDRVAVPRLVLALQSIRRDFNGIPMVVAWQGISAELKLPDAPPGDFYNDMFKKVIAGTAQTNGWYYINIHHIGLESTPPGFPLPNIFSTHLNDDTHAVVGGILGQAIAAIMKQRFNLQ